MRIFAFLLGIVLFLFLFLTVGNIILQEFPQLQPMWDEFKFHVVNIYNYSIVKYGALPTVLLIAALFIVIGSSKKI